MPSTEQQDPSDSDRIAKIRTRLAAAPERALRFARGFVGPLAMLAPMSRDIMDTAIQTLAETILAAHGKNDFEWLITKLEELQQRHKWADDRRLAAEKDAIILRKTLQAADVLRASCNGLDKFHDDAQPFCVICGTADGRHRLDCSVPGYDAARAEITS